MSLEKWIAIACLALSGCLNWEALSPDGGSADGGSMDGSVSTAIEGFGAVTSGGDSQPEVHVTTLSDDGAGSLREALRGNNRRIVFDVGGTVTLQSDLTLSGASFITIDGRTAPSPGITLIGRTFSLEANTRDVIVRNLRVRNTSDDAIRIQNSRRIAIDHVSATGAASGCLDITEDSSEITVQWSLFHKTATGLATTLVGFGARRVSIHHNLYSGPEGNPQIANMPMNGETPNADVRNNFVWNWVDNGITVTGGARANVVANYLHSTSNPANGVLENAMNNQLFSFGNLSGTGDDPGSGNVSEFSAPPITEYDACRAARTVRDEAGARPRDGVDEALLSSAGIFNCP